MEKRVRFNLLAPVVLGFFGCSSPRSDVSQAGDASTGAPLERDESAHAIAAVVSRALAPVPTIGDRFAPNTDGFVSTKDGITSPGFRAAVSERARSVGAKLPATADAPIEAGIGVSELYRVSLAPVKAAASPAVLDEGRTVYRDVFPSTDVTFGASAERIEWAYTLRDEKAPSDFAFQVKLPKHITSAHLDAQGGLELDGEEGDALLRMPRPMAVDAAGEKRDASLVWDGKTLTVHLDPHGLKYPIVLDPALETVVWQARILPPAAREGHVMAFDSIRNRTVLFGGYDGTSTTYADTWEWDGVVWSLRATSGPASRSRASMTFDSSRGVMVLFGGQGSSGFLNDLWEWDGATASWTKKCLTAPCTTSMPAARAGQGLQFHPPSGKSVLFGGYDGVTAYADTWTWNGSLWSSTGVSGPSGRQVFAMTYDATVANPRVLLFGGQSGSTFGGPNTYYNDLWAWNGSAWSSVTTSGGPPSARSQTAMVYQANGKVLLFGGWTSGGGVGDAWLLTTSTNAWTSSGATQPSARYQHGLSYDSSRSKVVLFGGYGAGAYGDTQEWDSGTETWSIATGQVPGRTGASMVYDSFRNRTVLFGGQTLGTRSNDTWEYTGLAWTRVCATPPCSTTLPPGRSFFASAYDSKNRKLLIFGGLTSGGVVQDTWLYDGDTWASAGTTKPPARSSAGAAFDANRNRVVLFGGMASDGTTLLRDTWEWNGSDWAQVCTTSPCKDTLPAAGFGHSLTFDPVNNRVLLFGGSTNAASFGETWAFSGTAWTLLSSTGPGPRYDAGFTWDTVRKRAVLFGGAARSGGSLTWLGDTWEWNGSSWSLTVAEGTGGPTKRMHPGMAYDVARRRTVLFSGQAAAASSDTWEYYSRGSACTLGSECSTGYCVDGVCCEQLSCGTCQACDLAGSIGTCTPVTSAPDPDSCPAGTSSCDAAGVCKLKQAQPCSSNGQCASGFCADNYCCNSACSGGCDVCNSTPGTCTTLSKGATGVGCGAYFCDGSAGSCPTTCAADTDCGSGYFCASGGICQARRAQGGSCNVGTGGDCLTAGCRECSGSLTCKDGYCCNGGCTGSCQTCSATPGTCTTVTNADDLDTCTGTSTCSASGACLARPGSACTLSTQCASGNCVDGYCCNTACAGGCDVCNSTPGTCTVLAQGSSGVSCGAYVCNGSAPACPTTCGNDADCASGYYCSASGTCVAQKTKGNTCNAVAGADCKSSGCRVCATGNCVDGYCCDTACGGSCDACNGAALGWPSTSNGTCALAPVSYAGSPACVTYACNGSSASCASSCTSDAQCATGFYCNAAGSCAAQKAQGNSCNLATDCRSGSCRECATGNCVDGYCCNSACNGQCQACDAPGTPGLCVTVNGPVHLNPAIGARVACAGSGACGASCNGTDANACHYAGASVACGTTTCTAGIQTNVGTCNGGGACNQTTTPCLTYGCNTATNTCKSSCTADADCASSSYYCAGTACVSKKALGEACGTSNNACLSGNCVDGVCCSTATCGSGQRCNLAGSLGTCAKSNGVACGTSTECGSGFCVDGVCCDSKCGSQCAACDLTGKVGTCSAVSGPPRGGRSACSGVGAGTECGQTCDGTDVTACHYPNATKSCGANSCTLSSGSYIEKHTSVCDGSGACSDVPRTCGGYVCGASACKASCTVNADCATGNYCRDNACVPIEGLGTPCTGPSTCSSGFCTDGVCCATGPCDAGKSCSAGSGPDKGFCRSLNGTSCSANAECVSKACVDTVCCDTACDGACEACNKVGSVGKCVPVVGTPLVGHPACTGTSTDADCAQRCDGTDGKSCKYPGTTASCGKPSCGGGVETEVSTCDGAGTCKSATKTCAPYVCGPTACLASCSATADCAKGNYCKSGSCVKVEALGKSCSNNDECDSGFCTNGVCCTSATCGDGSSCSNADSLTPGTCLKKNSVGCLKGDECATGRCVDGVCCDLACDGQCEACDVKGSEGACTPVVGPPHGARVVCDGKDAKDCSKAQCDGKTRDKCEGWANGGTTSCGEPSCTSDKRYQAVGACDGAGKCAVPDPKPCTPYACDATASSGCKTTCTTEADCAADYKCEAGACVQGATCSEDKLSSIDKAGKSQSCTPYRCGTDGKCLTACATSDDCAAGTTCDPTVKACVILAADQGGDGGCGCRTPSRGESRGGALAALLIGALAMARRRRAGV